MFARATVHGAARRVVSHRLSAWAEPTAVSCRARCFAYMNKHVYFLFYVYIHNMHLHTHTHMRVYTDIMHTGASNILCALHLARAASYSASIRILLCDTTLHIYVLS